MTLIGRFWHAVVDLTTWLTMSPVAEFGLHPSQHPLGLLPGDPPVFRPPAGNPSDHDFKCDYSRMRGWHPCSIPENRECWLRHKDGREYNIHTDYENFAPRGITRYYTLNVTESSYNADGLPFPDAKLFNKTYPGPWLEACWGDVSATSGNHAIPANLPMHRP